MHREPSSGKVLPAELCVTVATQRFFERAIAGSGVPERGFIDKCSHNLAGLQSLNVILKLTKAGRDIKTLQVKYLNDILDADHQPDASLQSLPFGHHYIRRDRNHAHDSKGKVRC